MVADVGPVVEVREPVAALLANSLAAEGDKPAAALYRRLFTPFESKLAAAKVVYLAPTGCCTWSRIHD